MCLYIKKSVVNFQNISESEGNKIKFPVTLTWGPCSLNSYSGNSCNTGETYSVSWTEDGSIISGGNGHVTLMDCSLQVRHTKRNVQYADCVREYGNQYLAMFYNNSSYMQTLSKDFTVNGTSFAKNLTQLYCHFCLTSSYVAVVNRPKKSIDIYDRMDLTMKKSIATDLATLRGIHALDDNNVVVTDHDTHVVRLYKLDTETVVWTYIAAKKPTGIASDTGGFIYVAVNEPKEICILSPDGKAHPLHC